VIQTYRWQRCGNAGNVEYRKIESEELCKLKEWMNFKAACGVSSPIIDSTWV